MFDPATTLLLIDAASRRACAGLWQGGARRAWCEAEEEAGQAAFRLPEACLAEAGIRWDTLDGILFCEGPGSVLGIRTVAMALRVWRTLPRPQPLAFWSYRSLNLAALQVLAAGGPRPVTVIMPGGKHAWFRLVAADEAAAAAEVPERVEAGTPPGLTGRCLLLRGFKQWQPPPAGAEECDYRPAGLERFWHLPGLVRPAPEPDAWMPAAPAYRRWDGASAARGGV